MLGKEWSRPNSEARWDDYINPPPRGWEEVWKQFHGLMGTPRDFKTRFKYLHRGLWTQHKLSLVAAAKHSFVSDRCILCGRHRGTHKHFVECEALDRSFDWFSDFGELLHIPIHMNTEDRVYATMNGGEKMPSGLRYFYSLLFKRWWMGYTTQNHQGDIFREKTCWLAAVQRLRMAVHDLEIDTRKSLEQIERTLHPILGYHPAQTAKAVEKEIERKNAKIFPLGEFSLSGERKMNFKWKDLRDLALGN